MEHETTHVPVKWINKKLRDMFGVEQDSGLSKWRLSWSTDQREIRYGTFREFYHGIFLRETTGAKECEKYPWVKDRWILEKLVSIPHPLIPSSMHGSYEIFYVFQDENKKPKEPWFDGIVWAIKTALEANNQGEVKYGPEYEAEEERKEVEYFEEMLKNDESGPLTWGTGITNPGLPTEEGIVQ